MSKPTLLCACLLIATTGLGLSAACAAEEKTVPPDLLAAMKDKDPAVRVKTIMALSKLGAEAVPPLVEALRDEEPQVRQAAAYALRLLRADPQSLVAALKPHVQDKNADVRRGVVGGLAKGGADAVPLLVPVLKDSQASVRGLAVQSLQAIVKQNPKAIPDVLPALTQTLQDESPSVRLFVIYALARCGPDATQPLLTATSDSDAKVRANAIHGLEFIKADAKTILPALVKRLKEDKDDTVRQSALLTASKLGPEGLPVLLEGLKDREATVQNMALKGLGVLGPKAKDAVPAVKELVTRAEDPRIRAAAVTVLPRLGREGAALVVELFHTEDSAVRLACLKYLADKKNTPSKAAVPDLIVALKDKDGDVRLLAAHVLGQLGPDAKDAIPALKQAAADSEGETRMAIEKVIEKIQEK